MRCVRLGDDGTAAPLTEARFRKCRCDEKAGRGLDERNEGWQLILQLCCLAACCLLLAACVGVVRGGAGMILRGTREMADRQNTRQTRL